MQSEQELFRAIIRRWRSLPFPSENLTSNKIAHLVDGLGSSSNAFRIGSVLCRFPEYFRSEGKHLWSVRWKNIEKEHPDLWDSDLAALRSRDVFAAMRQALEDEKTAVAEKWREHPVRASVVHEYGQRNGTFWYEALVHLDIDAELPIPEGLRIQLTWSRQLGQRSAEGILLSYDRREARVILETQSRLLETQRRNWFFLRPNTEQLLEALQKRLTLVKEQHGSIAHKLLQGGRQAGLAWDYPSAPMKRLDESQNAAVETCLQHDLTLMWGPPGTGKTHTLGELMLAMALAGKRVLACATSNNAVDELALKFLSAASCAGDHGMELLETDRVLRFGHARAERVLAETRLFPHERQIQALVTKRHQQELSLRALRPEDTFERAALHSAADETKAALKDATKQIISRALVVMTTATQILVEEAFADKPFDLVIIDEASMLAVPSSVAAASFSNSRVMIAGDFRQLAPIALAVTEDANRWLHRSAFEVLGVHGDNPRHEALRMLKVQRRMEPPICQLINAPFYQNQLATELEKRARTRLQPCADLSAVLLRVRPVDGATVKQTPSHSRCNTKNAEIVARLVREYVVTHDTITVGIVTPYRAQVEEIKKRLSALDLSSEQSGRILVGTIHAFQGSERDVIIWDLVDTSEKGPGRLYQREQGDRLCNVAVSRAKSKLVVVGDDHAFLNGTTRENMYRIKVVLQKLEGRVDLEDHQSSTEQGL